MSSLLAGNAVYWHLLRKWDHIHCCEIFENAVVFYITRV